MSRPFLADDFDAIRRRMGEIEAERSPGIAADPSAGRRLPRCPAVQALAAEGYRVFGIDPAAEPARTVFALLKWDAALKRRIAEVFALPPWVVER